MSTPLSEPTSPAPDPTPRQPGVFYHLQFIIGAALLIATLFTAWTPGSTVPDYIAAAGGYTVELPVSTPTPFPTADPNQPTRAVPLIGLVSGHWGHDSGSVCSDGLTEAEVNQTIAAKVQQGLVAQGYDVELLQEFDPKLRGYRASALVSIHADSCTYINDQATGFKVSAALYDKNPERSAYLTSCLRSTYAQATGLGLHSTSVTVDMSSYHAFEEIDSSTPAAIIEVGFLNLDRQLLTQNPDRAAAGIINGIVCYLRGQQVEAPSPASPTVPAATP
jgi:N-acetylmuramoyl-L-alanine amidase